MRGSSFSYPFLKAVHLQPLNFKIHSRSFKDFIYIYPVVSRRSNGVSLGINLNTNNACNWRCVYCQVEGLVRGKPVPIDLIRIEYELDYMLDWISNGDFLDSYAPVALRRFNDIALSGNGESTLSSEFLNVVKIIEQLRNKYKLDHIKTILITNGSEIDKPDILNALAIFARNNGEVWFKIDSATVDGISKINQVNLSVDGIIKKVKLSASICNTYIQTCLFRNYECDPTTDEINAYISLLRKLKHDIIGVLLYSTARNPALAEGANISQVSDDFLYDIAIMIQEIGILVHYYV